MAPGKSHNDKKSKHTARPGSKTGDRAETTREISFANKKNKVQQARQATTAASRPYSSNTKRPTANTSSVGGSSREDTSVQDGSKKGKGHGFRIGPKPQKGVYTGKADKIKASLIHNAKVKRDYAKLLKRERPAGTSTLPDEEMEQQSQQDDFQEDDVGETSPPLIEDEDVEIASGGESEEEEGRPEIEDSIMLDSGKKKVRGKGKQRLANVERSDTPPIDFDEPARPILRKRKSSELDAPSPSTVQDESEELLAGPSSQPFVHPSRRPDNRRSKHQQRIEESRVEADREPAKKRARLSEEEVERLRLKRVEDKMAWSKKGRKGQPNMGSRIGVLLGKIERSARG